MATTQKSALITKIDKKPEIRQFTTAEAAWLAAVIDGEGMRRVIGCGSSIRRVSFGKSHIGRKPMYHYVLKGSARCYWVLFQIVSFLIIKKEKAKSILNELETKPFGRWANATPEARKKQSDRLKLQWKNPAIRARRMAGIKSPLPEKRRLKMAERKVALVSGISGQDGSYLAELLLDKGYSVHGILRRSSSFNTGRIDHIFDRLHLVYGDLTDSGSIAEIVSSIRPTEIYNLGAQSHVRVSFDAPRYTADVDAIGTLNLLQAVKAHSPESRVYQASSSELFGMPLEVPQRETTPFYPRSPYGVAKLFGYWTAVNYRESYGIFASNGILFNHESPRRGETFVSRKITKAVARIHHGYEHRLLLGNLDAKRDWGYAKEYVECM